MDEPSNLADHILDQVADAVIFAAVFIALPMPSFRLAWAGSAATEARATPSVETASVLVLLLMVCSCLNGCSVPPARIPAYGDVRWVLTGLKSCCTAA